MYDSLIDAALAVRERAHAPFSNFQVGAALLDSTGRIHTGCNVENATYGLTLCAERLAVFKAISEGAREFVRIAIAADTDSLTPPCGAFPADPVGILRRYRSYLDESSRGSRDAPVERSVPEAIRCVVSLVF